MNSVSKGFGVNLGRGDGVGAMRAAVEPVLEEARKMHADLTEEIRKGYDFDLSVRWHLRLYGVKVVHTTLHLCKKIQRHGFKS